jgi:predicted MPP superfamily phosphohydrolase
MNIIWVTDLHLNFVPPEQIQSFFLELAALRPACLLVGGDIGDGATYGEYLRAVAELLKVPVYFVLGNHDFYRSSIEADAH